MENINQYFNSFIGTYKIIKLQFIKENNKILNLIIKGYDRSTIITDIYNVIPRTDISIEYYKNN